RRPRRLAQRQRRADVAELRLVRPVGVEDLNALVARVGDVDVAARVDGEALHSGELTVLGSGRSPLLEELAVLVEFRDAVVRADPVCDVDVARAVPRDVGRTAERGARDAGARRAASS